MQKKLKTVGETTSELTNNSVKFEVGATYEFYGSPVIKVKSRTEKTAEVYNYLEFKHEKKRIFVREDGVEYINLPNTGVYTISAERKAIKLPAAMKVLYTICDSISENKRAVDI